MSELLNNPKARDGDCRPFNPDDLLPECGPPRCAAVHGASYHELDEANAELSSEIALAYECLAKSILIMSLLGQNVGDANLKWAKDHNFNPGRSLQDALSQLTLPSK